MQRRGVILLACLEAAVAVPLLRAWAGQPLVVTTADPVVRRLPCAIRQPGSYRLERDLRFDRRGGVAIRVEADNVTLDLAGHEIRCTNRRPDRSAVGVAAENRQRLCVENGRITGFATGIRIRDVYEFDGPVPLCSGHVLRRLVLSDCSQRAISLHGNESIIEENLVVDTGPSMPGTFAYGIESVGIGNRVRRNEVVGTIATGARGEAVAICFSDLGREAIARENVVVNHTPADFRSIAIWTGHRSNVHVRDNVVRGFTWGITYSTTTRGAYSGNVLRNCDVPICIGGVDAADASPAAAERWVDGGGNVVADSAPHRVASRPE